MDFMLLGNDVILIFVKKSCNVVLLFYIICI